MITLYCSATPNGQKILLFLYETAPAHKVVPVTLSKGEHHRPEFLKISPNHGATGRRDPAAPIASTRGAAAD